MLQHFHVPTHGMDAFWLEVEGQQWVVPAVPPPDYGRPGNVTQHSPGVGNCADCLVDAGNRNTRYATGLVPSLQARQAV